jgi:signal peptidase I
VRGHWRRIAIGAVAVAALVFFGAPCIGGLLRDGGDRTTVEGQSMEPTIRDGQRVRVEGLDEVERYDVVVYKSPEDQSRNIIGRVIGLPLETVETTEGTVFIDGYALTEPYLAEPPVYFAPALTLSADEYYILGDNRNVSLDSRTWGPVPQGNITAKVVLEEPWRETEALPR